MSPPNHSEWARGRGTAWRGGGCRTEKLDAVWKCKLRNAEKPSTITAINSYSKEDAKVNSAKKSNTLTTYRRSSRSTWEPPSRLWWRRAGVTRVWPSATFQLAVSTLLLKTRLQVHQDRSSQLQHSTLCNHTTAAETAFDLSAGHAGRMESLMHADQVSQTKLEKCPIEEKNKPFTNSDTFLWACFSFSLPFNYCNGLPHFNTLPLPTSLPLSRSLSGSYLKGGKISLANRVP